MPLFPRKMVFYSSTKFSILKPWAIISNLIRFDLDFWYASKLFCRKLKYREKVLEDFQRLPRFPRKILLYSSTSFCILRPWAIISNLIRFVVGLCDRLQNHLLGNSNIGRTFWKSFNVCLSFLANSFYIRQPIFAL